MKRSDAAKFSFFLMMPAVAGATLLEIMELRTLEIDVKLLVAGMLAAFVSGYFAIKILLKVIDSYNLHKFSYYCIAIAVAGLLFLK